MRTSSAYRNRLSPLNVLSCLVALSMSTAAFAVDQHSGGTKDGGGIDPSLIVRTASNRLDEEAPVELKDEARYFYRDPSNNEVIEISGKDIIELKEKARVANSK